MNNSDKTNSNIKVAFDNIIQYIMKDNDIDIFALSDDNCADDNSILVLCIKTMTFYLIAEYKQYEKLVNIIDAAITNYFNSFNVIIFSEKLNKNIDIDLNKVYSDFDNVYKVFCNEKSGSNLSNLTKEKLNVNNKNCVIFILNMIYQYMDDENKELFLTYIPSIIYLIHTNYRKEVNNCIERLINKTSKGNEMSEIKRCLTTIPKYFSSYKTRESERKHQTSINSFLFVSLYNAIITNYKKIFIVNFLWFERNIGYYQYYLTAAEYSKVINFISNFEPISLISETDISIPTALYLNFKNRIPNDNKNLWEILDLIITEKTIVDDDMYQIFAKPFLTKLDNTDYFKVDYNSLIAYLGNDYNTEADSLKNKFIIHSIQTLYYRELLSKENFIKKNTCFYTFHCDEISDNNFKLENVTFDLWYTTDFEAENYFKTIHTDEKNYIVFPLSRKSYSVESALYLSDSIILIKKAEKILLKDKLIMENISGKLTLENVNFKNLRVEYKKPDYDKAINYFTSTDIVKTFNEINKTDTKQIYAFWGLYYFTQIEDYPNSRKNIIALYVNGLMEYQNFFPIRGIFDYSEMPIIIDRYLRTLRIYGSSTASGCSTSCSGSSAICTSNNISTSCSTVQGISAVGITRSCSDSCNATASSEAEQKNEK